MKVLIADDHPLVRKGLSSTLSFENDIEKIYEASNADEAINALVRYKPDISIIDLQLGKDNGLDIVAEGKKRNVQSKFIIFTSSSRKEDFQRAQAIDVDGYLLKEAFAEDITYAFRVVLRGKKFFDPEILQYKINSKENDDLEELTPREKDVLKELGKGLSNIQIGERLFISEHTVKKHVSNILSKLGLSHRTEAAIYINNYA